MRQRNFVPICAPGVMLGISRKMQKEPGRIVGSRLNRPVKWHQKVKGCRRIVMQFPITPSSYLYNLFMTQETRLVIVFKLLRKDQLLLVDAESSVI